MSTSNYFGDCCPSYAYASRGVEIHLFSDVDLFTETIKAINERLIYVQHRPRTERQAGTSAVNLPLVSKFTV